MGVCPKTFTIIANDCQKINDNSYKFTGYLQDATNRLLEFKIKEDK